MNKKTYKIIFIVSCLVFIVAFIFCAKDIYEYIKGDTEYNKIETEVVETKSPEEIRIVIEDNEVSEPEEESGFGVPVLSIDFAELQAKNPEVVAWIDFPGQGISYPVLQAADNDKYLKHTVNGNYNSAGAIFEDYRNTGIAMNNNTIFYGHNMKNGSMFGSLRKWKDKAQYEACPYFDIYTPDGCYRSQIIMAGNIEAIDSTYYVQNFGSRDEYNAYVSMMRKHSAWDMPEAVTEDSVTQIGYPVEVLDSEALVPIDEEDVDPPLILLSTCTGGSHDYRYVLLGQVIQFYSE